MKRPLLLAFFLLLSLTLPLQASLIPSSYLVSTESDPDSFINHSYNVINGDYCEACTDLIVAGPDPLILQRYYTNEHLGQSGGWRILPQQFLVLGKDKKNKERTVGEDRFEWSYAFAGERTGGILTYTGWKRVGGETKDPLKVDIEGECIGSVNTYSGEMGGKTNHQNNQLHCKGKTCELKLGDGTKRIYQKVDQIPNKLLGEELIPHLAALVTKPQYFRLTVEILPSGNRIFFSYNSEGHLAKIEIKNHSEKSTHAWVKFSYVFQKTGCQVDLLASDEKTVQYTFEKVGGPYRLTKVQGSRLLPTAYSYAGQGNKTFLTKKILSEGHFLEIEYDEAGRVKTLKEPEVLTGQPEITHQFSYGNGFTDTFNALGFKTRYIYDKRLQITSIEHYDAQGDLYRTDRKYWDKSGWLIARTVASGSGQVYSYRSFNYDARGNVLEERLFGNLTGKREVSLSVDETGQLLNAEKEESHVKTFGYSEDSFNLLTRVGDMKGNQTLYFYQPGTNRLLKKFIYDRKSIRKRTFHTYNEDGVCIKTIEDDGSSEDPDQVDGWSVTERHITLVYPKNGLPGVGLPEIIEEKGYNLQSKKEELVKKVKNTYSPQGDLLISDRYDANGEYVYSLQRTYDHLGRIFSETDPLGQQTTCTYDPLGRLLTMSIPHQDQVILHRYDFRNQLIEKTIYAGSLQSREHHTYDRLGRKISSTDRFGQTTRFEYDPFDRLTRVIHPQVLDEQGKPIQPTFSYAYDIFGNVLSITDPKGYAIRKAYNLRGDPTKIHYPDGSSERFKYDPEGSLHRSLTKDQIITVYEYDYLGRETYAELSTAGETGISSFFKSRSHSYTGFRLTHKRDDTHSFRFKYDAAGRLITQIEKEDGKKEDDPESRKVEIVYDPLGREHKKKIWFDTGPNDYSWECQEYDLLNQVIEKRVEDAAGNILLQRGYVYNGSGQRVEEYAIQNRKKAVQIKTAYDPFGKPTHYTDASGNETHILIDYSQDALQQTIINSLGIQTHLIFDPLGRLISLTKKDPFGPIFSQNLRYDSLGNKTQETNHIFIGGEFKGSQTTEWVYGPMGHLEKLIEAKGSPEQRITHHSYDSQGRMESKTIPGASPITYTYNKQGFLFKVQHDSKKDLAVSNSYSYDRQGNITYAHALHGKTVKRSYNVFNQVTEETVDDGEGKYTLNFSYDRKGRLKSIRLPDRSSIAYTYDAFYGREVKRLSSTGELLYAHTYDSYDALGRLTEESLIGQAGARKTTFDAAGRKTSIQTDYFTESVPEKGYNPLGHLLELNRGHEQISYSYNALSQLIEEKQDITKKYSYDSLDNRLKTDDTELFYNSLNQLTHSSKAEYSYDTQGNLLRKILDGEETNLESNALSQLISIEKSNKTTLYLSYDPFGRRLTKRLSDTKGKYKKTLTQSREFYFGYHQLGSLDAEGNIQNLRIPGLSGNSISLKSVAIELTGQLYAPIHDISGNLITLIDPTAKSIVESYRYSAFGEERIYNASGELQSHSLNPWRYAEKRIDEETGFICFGLRYFDPSIGRWISQDPSNLDGPNFYAYLHNNPINAFDRFGLSTETESNQFDDYFSGEVETHCYCEKHRTCKRGGDIGKTVSSQLPRITYCNNFEQLHKDYRSEDLFIEDFYDNSSCYDLSDEGLPDLPNDLGIGFINGIGNDLEGSKKSARYLSKIAGYNIHGVYNATHGNPADLQECEMGLNYIATEPVLQLHKMWNSFFDKSSSNAKFLMFCHSQGAIHVRNALLDYPPELRKRIIVVAIAPAAYIYKETCADVIHYRAEHWYRDFIPRIDQEGAKRSKDTIVDLRSHANAPYFDHAFCSPTYEKSIRENIDNYINHLRR